MKNYRTNRLLSTTVVLLLAVQTVLLTAHADVTWDGSESGDWSDPNNWAEVAIPGPTHDVYLNANGNSPTNQDIAALEIKDLYFDIDFTSGITIDGESFSLDDIQTPDNGVNVVHHKILCDLTLTENMDNVIQDNITVELAGSIGDGGNGYYIQQGITGGTTILSGSNTYSGITKANLGDLYFYDDENLGTAPATPTPGHLYASYGYVHLDKPSGENFNKVTINANRGIQGRLNFASDVEMHYAGAFAPQGANLYLSGDDSVAAEAVMHVSGDSSVAMTAATMAIMDDGLVVLDSATALGVATLQTDRATLDLNGKSVAGDMTEYNTGGLLDGTGNGSSAAAHFVNNDLDNVSVLTGDYLPGYYAPSSSRAFGGRGDITMTGGYGDGGNAAMLYKLGSGTLTLGGSNSYSSETRLMCGSVVLDHSTDNNPKLSSNLLCLLGCDVTLLGNASSASTETVGDLKMNLGSGFQDGSSFLSVVAGNADATFSFDQFLMLDAGSGLPLDFRTNSTGSGTARIIGRSATNESSGILSCGATFNGQTWATVDANSNIVGLADGSFSSTLATDVHWDVPDGTATVSANTDVESVRFDDPDAAMTVSINSGFRLRLNQLAPSLAAGILMTPQAGGNATISGDGYIQVDNYWHPIIIHQYNTNHTLTISAQIQDNINNGLCKAGPGEAIVNNDANNFDDVVGVYGGTLAFTSIGNQDVASSLGTGATDSSINIGTATLKYTGTGHTTDRPIWVRGLATIEAAGSGTLRLTNAVAIRTPNVTYSVGSQTLILTGSGDGQVDGNIELGALGALYKRGAGTWTLNGTNTYRYPTVIEAGTLAVNGSMRGDVEVGSGGTLRSSGATFKRDLTLDGTLAYDISDTSTNLNVWGEVTLSGALEITQTGGTPGTILTSDYPISGTFSAVTEGYMVTYNPYSVILSSGLPQGTVIIVQ